MDWEFDENKDQKFDVYLKKDNKVIATINIKDEIKKGTKEVFKNLKENKYTTILISGDQKEKCDQLNQILAHPIQAISN